MFPPNARECLGAFSLGPGFTVDSPVKHRDRAEPGSR